MNVKLARGIWKALKAYHADVASPTDEDAVEIIADAMRRHLPLAAATRPADIRLGEQIRTILNDHFGGILRGQFSDYDVEAAFDTVSSAIAALQPTPSGEQVNGWDALGELRKSLYAGLEYAQDCLKREGNKEHWEGRIFVFKRVLRDLHSLATTPTGDNGERTAWLLNEADTILSVINPDCQWRKDYKAFLATPTGDKREGRLESICKLLPTLEDGVLLAVYHHVTRECRTRDSISTEHLTRVASSTTDEEKGV